MNYMKRSKKSTALKSTEYVDDEGKKWVQTSTEDLFSIKEIQDVFEEAEKDREDGEILLARIDFQRVNRDYYDRVMELQEKLKKRTDLLKRVVVESKQILDKKNDKLKELILYIKKLHIVLARYQKNPEDAGQVINLSEILKDHNADNRIAELDLIIYEDTQEIMLDEEGKDSAPA
jgi:hypothetical protein